MTTTLFTDDWTFFRAGETSGTPVRLPHDAMIAEQRSADAGTGNHGGYFPGGVYRYTRRWTVPADAAQLDYRLVFEGVYGDTVVAIDGREIARNVSGYRAFEAPLGPLTPGQRCTIEVTVDNSRTPNSRWYTGSGIYRQLWLDAAPAVHIPRDGIRLTTTSLGPNATVDVVVDVAGPVSGHRVVVAFGDERGESGTTELALIDGRASGTIEVSDARAWSAEDPHLYSATVSVLDVDGTVVDEEHVRTGLRTIAVDAKYGLRINGTEVLLRGACVHHDNGVLGAATIPAAERRRARILKENGYNAIRSSHHPLSRAFLDACDELGLYVMDELTDVWFQQKTPHDTASAFSELWPDDARSMMAEDRNRPSVIMYSIGNEIGETATDRGVEVAGEISSFLHELDPSRPTTIAVNLLLNMMASRGSSPFDSENYKGEEVDKKKAATSTAANAVTAKLGRIMELASRLPAADRASRGAFAQVDIAGYNYAFGRYAADHKRYPDRVIVGSESMPGDLPAIWKRVEAVPAAIGDFMWTGWDYLGEAGIGAWSYGEAPGGINKPYPALLAGPGAIDITGLPGAPMFLAKAVWGKLEAPEIAVRPMNHGGERANRSPWRTSDAIASWAWTGCEGRAQIEVYSADDQVELLLNGRSLGRKRAGARAKFVARFTTDYEPGELVAVGYRAGRETGRSTLRSAEAVTIRIRSESETLRGADDLVFVWVELADDSGTVESNAADTVTVTVEGAAVLAGFGSAAPSTTESYAEGRFSTHFGRALAVVRGTGEAGVVTVRASSERHGVSELTLSAATLDTTIPA